MKRLDNDSGMTLTEVIVSMALVCIGILIITLAVAASQTLIRRGVDTGAAAQQAFTDVEQGGTSYEDSVEFRVGSTEYTVGGEYLVGGEDNTTAAAFQPKLPERAQIPEEEP